MDRLSRQPLLPKRLIGLVVLAGLAAVVVLVDGSAQAIPVVFGSLLLLVWLSTGSGGNAEPPPGT